MLRLSAGDNVLAFNGRDGEWRADIGGRKRADSADDRDADPAAGCVPDLACVFAPLKHARLDYMVQKAVEMGAARLQPVLTRYTQVTRVNRERMRANVIEARRAVRHPLSSPRSASRCRSTGSWWERDPARLLVFCDEAARRCANPVHALQGGAAGISRDRRR